MVCVCVCMRVCACVCGWVCMRVCIIEQYRNLPQSQKKCLYILLDKKKGGCTNKTKWKRFEWHKDRAVKADMPQGLKELERISKPWRIFLSSLTLCVSLFLSLCMCVCFHDSILTEWKAGWQSSQDTGLWAEGCLLNFRLGLGSLTFSPPPSPLSLQLSFLSWQYHPDITVRADWA